MYGTRLSDFFERRIDPLSSVLDLAEFKPVSSRRTDPLLETTQVNMSH